MSAVRRSLLLSFIEKYSILLINIAAIVILARLLTPAETGLYSVAAGIVNVAQTLRDFGVGNYVIQESELTRRRLSTALGISVILGVTMAAIFVIAAGPLAVAFHEPRLKIVIEVMSLNFILVAFAAVGTARLHRDMNFRAALRIGILAAVTHAATSILMAYHGFGAIGMAWASVLGVTAYLIGNYVCYAEDLFLLPGLSEWRRVISFGIVASGAYILQEMGQRSGDILVGRFLGFDAAGMFSRANGMVSLFQQALMNAVAPVALSALASLKRQEQDLAAPFLRFLSYTTLVAWPLLAVMALLALPIIQVAFGSQWLAAVRSSQFLCLAAAIAVLGRASITLFTATGKARRLFQVQLAGIPLLLVSVAVGATISIEAASIAIALGSLAHAAIALHHVNRQIATSWRQICRTLAASLLVTLVSLAMPVGIILTWGLSSEHFWPQTLVAGLTSIIAWMVCILLSQQPLGDEIRSTLLPLWLMSVRATRQFRAGPITPTLTVFRDGSPAEVSSSKLSEP